MYPSISTQMSSCWENRRTDRTKTEERQIFSIYSEMFASYRSTVRPFRTHAQYAVSHALWNTENRCIVTEWRLSNVYRQIENEILLMWRSWLKAILIQSKQHIMFHTTFSHRLPSNHSNDTLQNISQNHREGSDTMFVIYTNPTWTRSIWETQSSPHLRFQTGQIKPAKPDHPQALLHSITICANPFFVGYSLKTMSS